MDASFRVMSREVTPAGGSARVRIDAASGWFEGHFPGEPVLPGVAHLAVGAACGAFGGGVVRSIRGARLRVPLGPGDDVDVAWTVPAEDGAMRLTLAREARPSSAFDLELVSGPAADVAPEADTAGSIAPADPRDASRLDPLLPHRGRARLLVEILPSSDARLEALAVVPAGHPLSWCGAVASYLVLEVAAQAAAVHGAASMASLRAGGVAPRGYLVGARDVLLHSPALRCGASLRVSVEAAGSAPPLRVYRFAVAEGACGAATGEISVFVGG